VAAASCIGRARTAGGQLASGSSGTSMHAHTQANRHPVYTTSTEKKNSKKTPAAHLKWYTLVPGRCFCLARGSSPSPPADNPPAREQRCTAQGRLRRSRQIATLCRADHSLTCSISAILPNMFHQCDTTNLPLQPPRAQRSPGHASVAPLKQNPTHNKSTIRVNAADLLLQPPRAQRSSAPEAQRAPAPAAGHGARGSIAARAQDQLAVFQGSGCDVCA